MRAGRGTWRTTATGWLVAYVLVLQTLLGGLASGTHAGAAFALDAFGQVLCIGTDHGVPAGTGHAAPDCCSTACQLPLAGAAPPPPDVALAAPFGVLARAAFHAVAAAPRFGRLDGPHRARAPPLA